MVYVYEIDVTAVDIKLLMFYSIFVTVFLSLCY